jgi:intracellular septation protein A
VFQAAFEILYYKEIQLDLSQIIALSMLVFGSVLITLNEDEPIKIQSMNETLISEESKKEEGL